MIWRWKVHEHATESRLIISTEHRVRKKNGHRARPTCYTIYIDPDKQYHQKNDHTCGEHLTWCRITTLLTQVSDFPC